MSERPIRESECEACEPREEREGRERLASAALRPRPEHWAPHAPGAEATHRHLPLLAEARPIDRAHRPIYAVWELTLRCDQACRHCGSRAGRERTSELSTAECLDVVRQLDELGVPEVTLTGGEAYLRPDWTEIVSAIRARGMQCTMVTAGRGMTKERAEAAARAGLQSVSVSLDGLEATHDRLRGLHGSWRAGREAMRNLRAAGVQVSCNTQLNRLTVPELPALLDAIAAEGAHSWQLQLTLAMGRAADEPDVLLQPYDMLAVFEQLAIVAARCVERGVRLWPGNNLGYFGPHETLLRGATGRGHFASCGAGRGIVGIEADGKIKGCSSLPTSAWAAGSVRDHALVDLWERGAPLRYTRDRTLDDLWGYCRSCYYADDCRAGCTSTSFVLFGRAGNNPYCHHRALEHQRGGQRERLVLREAPPGRSMDFGTFELVVEDDPARRAPNV